MHYYTLTNGSGGRTYLASPLFIVLDDRGAYVAIAPSKDEALRHVRNKRYEVWEAKQGRQVSWPDNVDKPNRTLDKRVF